MIDPASIDAILRRAPVLPVLAIERLDDAVPLARALVDGGLPVLEVTLRSDVALEAIRRIVDEVPDAIRADFDAVLADLRSGAPSTSEDSNSVFSCSRSAVCSSADSSMMVMFSSDQP